MRGRRLGVAAGVLVAAVGVALMDPAAAQPPTGLAQSPGLTQSPMPPGLAPPVQLTSEQDHHRLLDLLHIAGLRRGPDGDPTSPRAANFDETKVEPYTLPDPLVLRNGQRVTSADAWWKVRRPQIVADFDNEMYGHVPAHVPKVIWEVVRTRHENVEGVPVVTKDLVGHVDHSAYPLVTVDIQLTMTTPEGAKGPVPVMMEFGLTPEVQQTLHKRFTSEQWAAYMGPGSSWQSLVLAKGWGYAILIPTSVQADNGEGLTQGIIGVTNKGRPRQPGDWGALRAWAWGASRALDYLQTDPAVNGRKVGIEGLSRYGKAALVTMAYDSRFAIAFVGSSGEAGAKLSRRTFGEQVENIASTSEYHWMAGNFLKYSGPLTRNDLPVDAHELIALCAPRPVFISSGAQAVEGGWVDAKGMFLAAVAAGPVYQLLHKNGLGTSEFPPLETALIDGDIAFRQHRYGHTTGPNWPTFLTFAGRYIDSGPARPAITGISHIAVYAADPARSERFYVHDLGAVKGEDPENPNGVRYYFSSTQFVEVLPLPQGPPSINRLDHVAFTTTDIQALRTYLVSSKVTVPQAIQKGSDGSRWLDVADPEGTKIEFVQPLAGVQGGAGAAMSATASSDTATGAAHAAVPLSSHIIHVGFIVHDRAREDAFFRTVLGFRPYWFGGMQDNKPDWVSQQVPDGTDWLEYMLVGTPAGHGIPPDMSAETLGVLNHFSLGVPNAEAAYTLLWNGGRLEGQAGLPKIGRDAKWQLNLLDPDGTRAEIMEFHAIGTPCCSPFTAPDPLK